MLHVLPADRHATSRALAKKLPTYVSDFETWAENNQQFQELNEKYDLTEKLTRAGELAALAARRAAPATLGNAPSACSST